MRQILSFSEWQSLNEQGPWGSGTLTPTAQPPTVSWGDLASALRQAVYHPLGIAASGALAAFTVTLPAVEAVYAILLIDDMVTWTKTGEINWANFIVDTAGLLSGSLLVAPLAAALKPVGLGIAKAGRAIEPVAKAIASSKVGPKVFSLLKKLGDSAAKAMDWIKKAIDWLKRFTDYFERTGGAGAFFSTRFPDRDLIQVAGQKTYMFVMESLNKILPKMDPAKYVKYANVAGHSAAGATKAVLRDQVRGSAGRAVGGLAEK